MKTTREEINNTMRLLALPAAIVLGVAMLLACAGKGASGPGGAQNFAAGQNPATNQNSAQTPGSSTTPNPSPGQASPQPAPSDGVRRVTREELQEALKQKKAILVDVRGDAAYNAEHIKGALNIAGADIANHLDQFPKDKLIVTYCS